MTKVEAQGAIRLIRNQLDKLPIEGSQKGGDTLQHAYEIVYEMWAHLEEEE